MLTLLAALALATLAAPGPAAANPSFTQGPYSSRGDCEAHKAALVIDDRESLLDRFPELFSTPAEVSSFVRRGFTCERGVLDGKWLLIDRRLDLLDSEWFRSRPR